MNRAELIIARLTEENDLQRASIQELSRTVAKMQKVVDVAKDIEINLNNMGHEPLGTTRFNLMLRQTYGFNKILTKALQEMEEK